MCEFSCFNNKLCHLLEKVSQNFPVVPVGQTQQLNAPVFEVRQIPLLKHGDGLQPLLVAAPANVRR